MGGHLKEERVDSRVAPLAGGIDGTARIDAHGPWLPPRGRASLQSGNDVIGDLLAKFVLAEHWLLLAGGDAKRDGRARWTLPLENREDENKPVKVPLYSNIDI
jgi:hypothetical protein